MSIVENKIIVMSIVENKTIVIHCAYTVNANRKESFWCIGVVLELYL